MMMVFIFVMVVFVVTTTTPILMMLTRPVMLVGGMMVTSILVMVRSRLDMDQNSSIVQNLFVNDYWHLLALVDLVRAGMFNITTFPLLVFLKLMLWLD